MILGAHPQWVRQRLEKVSGTNEKVTSQIVGPMLHKTKNQDRKFKKKKRKSKIKIAAKATTTSQQKLSDPSLCPQRTWSWLHIRCYPKSLRDATLEMSNLYAEQKGKTLNLTEDELLTFYGILLTSAYNTVPRWRLLWSDDYDVSNTEHHLRVESVMCHYMWSASRSTTLRRTCMKDIGMYGKKYFIIGSKKKLFLDVLSIKKPVQIVCCFEFYTGRAKVWTTIISYLIGMIIYMYMYRFLYFCFLFYPPPIYFIYTIYYINILLLLYYYYHFYINIRYHKNAIFFKTKYKMKKKKLNMIQRDSTDKMICLTTPKKIWAQMG